MKSNMQIRLILVRVTEGTEGEDEEGKLILGRNWIKTFLQVEKHIPGERKMRKLRKILINISSGPDDRKLLVKCKQFWKVFAISSEGDSLSDERQVFRLSKWLVGRWKLSNQSWELSDLCSVDAANLISRDFARCIHWNLVSYWELEA